MKIIIKIIFCQNAGGKHIRNIYVLYTVEKKVVEYSSSGSIIDTYTLIDTKSPVVGIHFNSDQGLFFETADETSYPLIEKGVKVSLETQIKRKRIGLSRNNDYFFLERKSPSQGTIKILDLEGKVRKELSVKKKDGFARMTKEVDILDGISWLIFTHSLTR